MGSDNSKECVPFGVCEKRGKCFQLVYKRRIFLSNDAQICFSERKMLPLKTVSCYLSKKSPSWAASVIDGNSFCNTLKLET
jgi:hypothetical protein